MDRMEGAVIELLTRESLNHANPIDVLSQSRRDPRGLLPHLAIGSHAMDLKKAGGDDQRGYDERYRRAQPPIVAQHQKQHAHERDQTSHQLIRAPGENPIHRIDIGVGPRNNPPLMGFVEVVKGEFLNMPEHRRSQVVHGPLACPDGGFDLRSRKPPSKQQIKEIEQADNRNTPQRQGYVLGVGQIVVNSNLDELWPKQLRSRGKKSEQDVERHHPAVGTQVLAEAAKSRLAHLLLGKRFLDQHIIIGVGHG